MQFRCTGRDPGTLCAQVRVTSVESPASKNGGALAGRQRCPIVAWRHAGLPPQRGSLLLASPQAAG